MTSTADAERLVEVLRRHPIPSASPKARQLDAWAELVAVTRGYYMARTSGSPGLASVLGTLAAELAEPKRYAGATQLCTCPSPGATGGRTRRPATQAASEGDGQ